MATRLRVVGWPMKVGGPQSIFTPERFARSMARFWPVEKACLLPSTLASYFGEYKQRLPFNAINA